MTITISGTSGVTYPAGGTDNVAGAGVGTTDSQTLTNKTITSPTIDGTPVMGASVITSGTAVASTSGTSIDFTSIPSWVKRITVILNGVSTSGSSDLLLRIGSGSFLTTGYNSASLRISAGATSTVGFILTGGANSSTYSLGGVITLATVGSNAWSESGIIATSSNAAYPSAGNVTLGGTLDRVRITTVNGTDTFDAGSINILYE